MSEVLSIIRTEAAAATLSELARVPCMTIPSKNAFLAAVGAMELFKIWLCEQRNIDKNYCEPPTIQSF